MKHLRALEDQSVYILREAYKNFDDLAMLWSMGKDSMVLLWLARKVFFWHVPFPRASPLGLDRTKYLGVSRSGTNSSPETLLRSRQRHALSESGMRTMHRHRLITRLYYSSDHF